MSHEIRLVRYVIPKEEYRPKPAYRRPGSCHRHVPSLSERIMKTSKEKRS